MTKPNPVVEALEDTIQMLEITMKVTGHIDAMCDEAIKSGKAALPLARQLERDLEEARAELREAKEAFSSLERTHRTEIELHGKTREELILAVRKLKEKP